MENIEKRIESESKAMRRITNDDLMCRYCRYRYDDSKKLGNTSRCEVYELKPNNVLLGSDCPYRENEE